MSRLSNLKIFILLAAIAFSGMAFAHSGAQGVVKQRMDMMSEIGKSMKVIGTMMRSAKHDHDLIKMAALEIQKHSRDIPGLFPDGSIQNPSEALPAIWVDWDEFAAISNKLDTDAGRLAEMAMIPTSIEDIKTQFLLIGKSCSGCHEKFRLKK